MDLDDVISHAARLGGLVYLATVTASGAPHVVPLSGGWQHQRFYVSIDSSSLTYRNLDAGSSVCVHFAVDAANDWDSLLMWGDHRILDGIDDKRRLWRGVLPYDLSEFDSGGPEDSPDSVFLEITPARALLLYHYGEKGRERWSRA